MPLVTDSQKPIKKASEIKIVALQDKQEPLIVDKSINEESMLVHGVSNSKIIFDQAVEDSDEEVLLQKAPFECDISKDYESESLNSSAAENELNQSKKQHSGMLGFQQDDALFIGLSTPRQSQIQSRITLQIRNSVSQSQMTLSLLNDKQLKGDDQGLQARKTQTYGN